MSLLYSQRFQLLVPLVLLDSHFGHLALDRLPPVVNKVEEDRTGTVSALIVSYNVGFKICHCTIFLICLGFFTG